MAGFISERVAGFTLECLAGFVGIRTSGGDGTLTPCYSLTGLGCGGINLDSDLRYFRTQPRSFGASAVEISKLIEPDGAVTGGGGPRAMELISIRAMAGLHHGGGG